MNSFRKLLLTFLMALTSCASAPVAPSVIPVKQSGFRHPVGLEIEKLRETLFKGPQSPAPESLVGCDFDFNTERTLAQSDEELLSTFPAHVRGERERYHWCFYGKLLQLQESLAKTPDREDRQKLLLDGYLFLTYIARIMQVDFADPNYLASAIYVYRKTNAGLSSRKLQISPKTQMELGRPEIPVLDDTPAPSN